MSRMTHEAELRFTITGRIRTDAASLRAALKQHGLEPVGELGHPEAQVNALIARVMQDLVSQLPAGQLDQVDIDVDRTE
jgi:hypothetical protein